MATVMRRLGIHSSLSKAKGKDTESRRQLQKNLFSCSKCSEHGFPSKPSTLVYDPVLSLLAIATRTGAIRIYGRPGVHLSADQEGDVAVTRMCFIPGEGRLITLCSDNTIHQWEIQTSDDQKSSLNHLKSFSLTASSVKSTVSSWYLLADGLTLLLGTESGDLHFFNVEDFKLTDETLSQDKLSEGIVSDGRSAAGAIESVIQSPTDHNKILIGYTRGMIVQWDMNERQLLHAYHADQQLESLSFKGTQGRSFVSTHSDGSYMVWSTDDSLSPEEDSSTPYGPFPCGAISKMEFHSSDSGDPLLIFIGGMPRANYGDRYTLSLIHGDKNHVVLDLTSKVVDFITISDNIERGTTESRLTAHLPGSLIVLAEEELIAVDLETDGWPVYQLPYLTSIHSSPITCVAHAQHVPDSLYEKITQAGHHLTENCSPKEWPIMGGQVRDQLHTGRELLLTGHEDGSIRFWDKSQGCMSLTYQLSTARMFGVDSNIIRTDSSSDVEWPPFRKVGCYDPFTDDPRLAIQTLLFCPFSETLLVTGQSGQVILHQFEREEREQEVKLAVLNLKSADSTTTGVSEAVWRSYSPLEVRTDDIKFGAGFQPTCVLQVLPPVRCSAVGFQPEWQLLAVASDYGFGLFDFAQKKIVLSFSYFNDSSDNPSDEHAHRSRSLRRSIRQSMRGSRLYRSVSAIMSRRKQQQASASTDRTAQVNSVQAAAVDQAAVGSRVSTGDRPSASASVAESSRHSDNFVGSSASTTGHNARTFSSPSSIKLKASIIRSIYFADTFLLNGQTHTPSLWLGTSSGQVITYRIELPASSVRDTEPVNCTLAKAVSLKHGAAIVGMFVIDRTAHPLPDPLEALHQIVKPADMSGGHQLVVCSQQQIKIFQLPSLKALNKFKMSSLAEESPIVLSVIANFTCHEDESYNETDIIGLTESLNIGIISLPYLRPQLLVPNAIRSGANICALTHNGMGYCLSAQSELHHFSLSTYRSHIQPFCTVTPAKHRHHATTSRVEGETDSKQVQGTPAVNSLTQDFSAIDAQTSERVVSSDTAVIMTTAEASVELREDQSLQREERLISSSSAAGPTTNLTDRVSVIGNGRTVSAVTLRHIDSQVDSEAVCQVDRIAGKQSDGHADRLAGRQSDDQADVQADGQTYSQADRQADSQVDGQGGSTPGVEVSEAQLSQIPDSTQASPGSELGSASQRQSSTQCSTQPPVILHNSKMVTSAEVHQHSFSGAKPSSSSGSTLDQAKHAASGEANQLSNPSNTLSVKAN